MLTLGSIDDCDDDAVWQTAKCWFRCFVKSLGKGLQSAVANKD